MNEQKTKFGYSGNSRTILKLAKRFHQNFYFISTFLGVILIAIGGDFSNNYDECKILWDKNNFFYAVITNNWVILFMGAIFGGFGIYGTAQDNKQLKLDNDTLKKENFKIDNLKDNLNITREENERLQGNIREKHEEVVKTWLKMISIDCKLTTFERLTIYYEDNGEFTLLSRYSQNKSYDKVHNQKFPLDKGVISKSWQHNDYKEEKSPLFIDDNSSYYEYMTRIYDYDQTKLETINMKSDKYYGLAIQEADENIGVLLYEKISQSDSADFVTKCTDIRRNHNKYQSYLTKYVKDAILLDRVKNVAYQSKSIENEVLDMLGGESE